MASGNPSKARGTIPSGSGTAAGDGGHGTATSVSAPAAPGETRDTSQRPLKPRDAATLVLIDRSGDAPRILMGRRRPSQVFLPGKFVFPGGGVDRCDRSVPTGDELPATCRTRLLFDMKGTPSPARAKAIALAAIRETFEEAGLVVGTARVQDLGELGPSLPRNESWRRFFASGFVPRLQGLTFFARAITPPARPRRYDTRFFMAEATDIALTTPDADEELVERGWFNLNEVRNLDLPNITRAVLEDLAGRLHTPGEDMPVPYYSYRHGSFRRDLIT